VWDASFGQVYGTLLADDADNVAPCAAALGLRLHECCYPGEWALQGNTPSRFRFGRWVLPPANAVRVSASASQLSISVCGRAGWDHYTFQRGEEDWEGADVFRLPVLNEDAIRLRVFDSGQVTSAATRLVERLGFNELNGSKEDVTTATLESAAVCSAGLGLIRECSELYLPWVARVLRNLVLLPPTPGITYTGSDKTSPGAICLSKVNDRVAVAEILVHEATHQYFHILLLELPSASSARLSSRARACGISTSGSPDRKSTSRASALRPAAVE
jgi:HEXXH motif-containing protein